MQTIPIINYNIIILKPKYIIDLQTLKTIVTY